MVEAPLNAISDPFITEGFGLGGTLGGAPLVAVGLVGAAAIAGVATAVSVSNSTGTPPVVPPPVSP